MNRIDQKFQELKRNKKKAFIAFITAGDPDISTTQKLVIAFEKSGVDIVELGVPFSDPMADGPTIQASSARALAKGINLHSILNLVRSIRKTSNIPIALMMYYNSVFHYGEAKFMQDAKKSGVDGLIIPDLPPQEAKNLIKLGKKHDMSIVFFLAPTTRKDRVARIAQASTGFIYYVSLTGVTGARQNVPSEVIANLRSLRAKIKKPICVGFGVSRPEHVRKLSSVADGVIVGSAIINQIVKNQGKKNLVANVARYVRNLARCV